MPEIRAVGRLGHNGHIHFRKGLRVHAPLNEGDSLGQPFLRQFKHQFVVNLQKRLQPRALRQADDQPGQRQLQYVGGGSLNGRIQRAALGKGFPAPVLRTNTRKIAAAAQKGLRVLPRRACSCQQERFR